MQGFWNLIGKAGEGPGKDFQYDVGEKASSSFDSKSIWTLYHGKKKVNGDIVTIFICDGKVSSPDELQLAKTGHKRLKTLRHPNIIKYLDGFESENLVYVVTEAVIPLSDFLEEEDGRNANLITWGLYQVVTGLSFLINNGGLLHENVNIFSIFVGLDGEWKLGGVEYVHNTDTSVVAKLPPYLSRYDPPEGNVSNKKEKWSSDAWGLGCLIWEIYNGVLQKSSDLKVVNKVPKQLLLHYCDLVHANPKKRTNPKDFLEKCLQAGQFFDNQFLKANLFLNEIQIKDSEKQKEFFMSLDKSLDSFPKQFCVHKVLPQLINAFEFGEAGSAVLSPLFKVGLLLDEAAYQAKIVPCIIKLFSSNDRATRIQLLQQMEKFVKHLQPSVVDNQIFACVATGFGDTLPAMREQTVKAMLHLVPKLSPKTINNQLLRFFAKLQMDEQPGIRTNTTICLGKIAGYIPADTRKKMLAPGFIRAVHDPFPHARNAGIMAMLATQKYYSSTDIATRLLPALCAVTVDPERSVRDSAFKVIRSFLSLLETYSNDPENAVNADITKEEEQGSTWTGWAVSSFTSRFYQNTTDINKSKPDADTAEVSNTEESNDATSIDTSQREDEMSDHSNYDDTFGDEYWDDKKKKVCDVSNDTLGTDFNDVKKELAALKDNLNEVSHKTLSGTNAQGNKSDHDSDSDYGDWGAGEDSWGQGNDDWGSFNEPKSKPINKPKRDSATNSKNEPVVKKSDKFAVQPFSEDSPKLASSLFDSSSSASDFDGLSSQNQINTMLIENDLPTEVLNNEGQSISTHNNEWESNTDEWGLGDWNNDGMESDKKKENSKEKRREELQRRRDEQKLKRELANKEKRAKSSASGAMKLGTVKKNIKGDG